MSKSKRNTFILNKWYSNIICSLFFSKGCGICFKLQQPHSLTCLRWLEIPQPPKKKHCSPNAPIVVRIVHWSWWHIPWNHMYLEVIRWSIGGWEKQKLYTTWWFQPVWKILNSQIGSFPQENVKIKNVWNHHLVQSRYHVTIPSGKLT